MSGLHKALRPVEPTDGLAVLMEGREDKINDLEIETLQAVDLALQEIEQAHPTATVGSLRFLLAATLRHGSGISNLARDLDYAAPSGYTHAAGWARKGCMISGRGRTSSLTAEGLELVLRFVRRVLAPAADRFTNAKDMARLLITSKVKVAERKAYDEGFRNGHAQALAEIQAATEAAMRRTT